MFDKYPNTNLYTSFMLNLHKFSLNVRDIENYIEKKYPEYRIDSIITDSTFYIKNSTKMKIINLDEIQTKIRIYKKILFINKK